MILPTHRRAILSCLVVTLLLTLMRPVPASPGVAQNTAGPAIPVFGPLREFDTDCNGWLDGPEQRAAAGVFVSWADTDGDGKLAETELRRSFTTILGQPGVSRLALWYDANHDGKLSSSEREAAYAAFKARLAGLR